MADDHNKKDERLKIKDSGSKIHESCILNLEAAQKEIAQLKVQLDTTDGKYKRALADYQNLERQMLEAQQRIIKMATADFVQVLLQPFAHLQLAAKHLQDKGLDMVISQFKSVFESQGLKEIVALDQPFDATKMEAIATGEGEADKVLEVAAAGYELNGEVIVPAKVIVGKK